MFSLTFVGILEGSSVSLDVKKEGLEVVNISDLKAIAGQRDEIRISMASPAKVNAYRLELYHIGVSAGEKAIKIELNKAKKDLDKALSQHIFDSTQIATLTDKIAVLAQQMSKVEDQSNELAEKYSKIDLDNTPAVYKVAFDLFRKGLLDSSLKILNSENLPLQIKDLLIKSAQNDSLKKIVKLQDSMINSEKTKYVLELSLKVDIHRTKFQIDSALQSLAFLMQLDSNNVEYLFKYAYLLDMSNENDSSIVYYNRALAKKATASIEAKICNNLALIYSKKNIFPNAISLLTRSKKIRYELLEKDYDAVAPELVGTLNALGNIYSKTNQIAKAFENYHEALNLYKSPYSITNTWLNLSTGEVLASLGSLNLRLARFTVANDLLSQSLTVFRKINKDQYGFIDHSTAQVLTNLSRLYHETGRNQQADSLAEVALTIYKRICGENFDAFTDDAAHIYSLLGLICLENNDFERSKTYTAKGQSLFKKLVKKDPESFDPEVAIQAREFGNACVVVGDINCANSNLEYAFIALKNWAAKDFNRFGFDYALALHAFANFNIVANNLVEAASLAHTEIDVYKKLDTSGANFYALELGLSHALLGSIYNNMRNPQTASAEYDSAISLYNLYNLTNKTWTQDIYTDLYLNAGNNYFDLNDTAKCRYYLNLALTSAKEVIKTNPKGFKSTLSEIYNDLGNIYGREHSHRLARLYYDSALTIRHDLIQNTPTARYYNNLLTTTENIGNLYIQEEKIDSAEMYLSKSVEIAEELYHKYGYQFIIDKAMAQFYLGNAYDLQNKQKYSEPLYLDIVSLPHSVFGDYIHIFNYSLYFLGKYYFMLGDSVNSKKYLKAAQAEFNKIPNPGNSVQKLKADIQLKLSSLN